MSRVQTKRHRRTAVVRLAAVAVLLLALVPATQAQRQKVYTNGLWLCHFGTINLGPHFGIVTEAELHTKQWLHRWAEQVADVGVADRLNANWRLAAGVAWYRSAQYLNTFFFKNEWRGWQETSYFLRGSWVLWQRLRAEERWLQEVKDGCKVPAYDYVTRLRYRVELQKPIRNTGLTLMGGNEFMCNPGHLGSDRFLDQDRLWAGLGLKLAAHTTTQAQYMKMVQWRVSNVLEDQNVFRLNIVQQFNTRKS